MPKECAFPLLKPQELKEMLSEFLSVDAQRADFEKPTPEFVQRVYGAIVTVLLGPTS